MYFTIAYSKWLNEKSAKCTEFNPINCQNNPSPRIVKHSAERNYFKKLLYLDRNILRVELCEAQ